MQGSLKDFSVADILQLLSQQQKTGVLVVGHENKTAEVYFSDGEVCLVKTPHDTDLLGAMLVKSKLIAEDQLRQALNVQKNSLDHICTILLGQGLLNKESFEHIITTYSYEVFYEILQWRTGSYQFVPQKKAMQALVPLPGLESILLDVLRMIDEWPEIKKIISSRDMLLDNNYAALDDLDSDEERVCGLVDGRRSVQDIIDASLLGSFYTCKALVHLLERGAIRLLSSRAESGTEGAVMTKAAITAATVGAVAAFIIALVLLPGSFATGVLPALALLQPHQSALRGPAAQDAMLKIEKALDIYLFKNGNYPDRLSELVAGGILSLDDLAFVADNTTRYEKTKGSYELTLRL